MANREDAKSALMLYHRLETARDVEAALEKNVILSVTITSGDDILSSHRWEVKDGIPSIAAILADVRGEIASIKSQLQSIGFEVV